MPAIGFRYNNYRRVDTKVLKNETFIPMLERLGADHSTAYTMATLCDTVFSPRRMRAGATVECYYSGDTLAPVLSYAVYNHNRIKQTVFQFEDSLAIWNYRKPVVTEERYADITIASSLWADMIEAGADPSLAMVLADIYAWTVDFFSLQPGDRFQVIYDADMCEGELIGTGDVKFARYTSGKYVVNAIRFEEGNDKYYNEKGESLRKAFLKAPLKFTRVSSKFTYARKHPVTGKVRPHTGVDYAAPSGTPVYALGDGVVQSAGWTTTGGGNVIKIKHNNVYSTAYLHLKGFASGIRAGVRVRQGQLIGYVGSTGMSTGPHLDFRVWKNGQPIDPLHMDSPSAEPLPKEYLPQLQEMYSSFLETIAE